jgi:hypothetical protein
MTRRGLFLALALSPAAATAAPLDTRSSRPGIGRRAGVDEALRRTVTLVLRAEARSNGLPEFMTDPTPLPEETLALIVRGERLPPDLELEPAPDSVNRRLPHARTSSVWAAAGTWLIEVDPVRRTVLAIAHDVLPPDL